MASAAVPLACAQPLIGPRHAAAARPDQVAYQKMRQMLHVSVAQIL